MANKVRLLTRLVVLALPLVGGCVDDYGPRSAVDQDVMMRRFPPYDYRYNRAYRQYGPWDMPGTSNSPGPPTWYGCPQQSPRCYQER